MSGSQSHCHQLLHTDISQSNQEIGTLVRDFDEALLSDLECPVCTAYMIPPITLCCNGHNICQKCTLKKVQRCPVCRGRLSGIRNIPLETIARRQMYPCINRDKGCSQVFSVDLIADHEALCRYGPMNCPMNKFLTAKCSWTGLRSELKKHVTESHERYVSLQNSPFHLALPNILHTAFVMFFSNELFILDTRRKPEQCCLVVQLVGTKEESAKYISEFTFFGANGVDQIVETFVVRSFTEDVSDSFQSSKCPVLSREVIQNFSKDGKLKMLIGLSKIKNERE